MDNQYGEEYINLPALFATTNARILGQFGDNLFCAQEGSLFFISLRGSFEPAYVDLALFEPFDEVHYIASINRCLFIRIRDDTLVMTPTVPTIDGDLKAESEVTLSLPFAVDSVYSDQDYLFVHSSQGDTLHDTVIRIIFNITSEDIVSVNTVVFEVSKITGTPLALLKEAIVTSEDRTPYDPIMRIFGTNEKWNIELPARVWTRSGHALICTGIVGDRYGMYVIADNTAEFWPSPGYISQLVSLNKSVYAVIYSNGVELLYKITLDDLKPDFKPFGQESGKKSLFNTTHGLIYCRRDTSSGLTFRHLDTDALLSNKQVIATEIDFGKWTLLPLIVRRVRSPFGVYAHQMSLDLPFKKGTILHLHGGPDSYEVEELRFFGAFRTLLREGFSLVILNYRGSSGLPYNAYHSAWQNWDVTFPEDLTWLVEQNILLSNLPCCAVGWSFGASLALKASQYLPFIKSIVIGGIMSNLTRQRQRASNESQLYDSWFYEKFGPEGTDTPINSFFNLEDQLQRPVSTLSFHGIDDENCSYDDLQRLQKSAIQAGFDWTHYDLPGQGHYATTLEDARLIYLKTYNFIRDIEGRSI